MKSPKLEKKLDDLFSELVRKRAILRVGGCEKCLSTKSDTLLDSGKVSPAWKTLQCAHLISRVHKSTRWEEDIALGLCGGCHMYIDREAEAKIALLDEKIGKERADLLRILSNTPARNLDRSGIEVYLRTRLQEINRELDETH